MFCPRCGHQPISDTLRFCSYCGFKLGVVKAALADEDEGSVTEFTVRQLMPAQLRQRDINLGLILMFAGAALAALLAGRGGFGLGREGGAIILLAVFSALMLLSRPIIKGIYKLLSWEELPADSVSLNQRGMSFGSILMFISTILVAITSLLALGRMRTPEFFGGLLLTLVLLLVFSKYLMRAIRYLVSGEISLSGKDLPDPDSILAAAGNPALTASQEMPVSLFTSQRKTTAEILSPTSITEHTTNLLENK